ncbi:MAG: hypothetical protein HQ552_09140 [Desulfobacteraceae bacterium]|nr:hypothetical protein [Desulfobacteraceae bacterium]
MNIVKGLDRIALVIAVISILPGFFWGWKVYDHFAKEEITTKELEWAQKDEIFRPYRMAILEDLRHPPKWKCTIAGLTGSGATFFVALFGLRGLNRVFIWRVFTWVVEGFKDEKKDQEQKFDQRSDQKN